MKARALVADDEPHLARALVAALQPLWPGLEVVHVARQGLEAAERIAALQPDVAFLDIRMPGLTGLEVAEGIEGRTRVVFVTAFDEYAVEAFEREALDYVLKPIRPDRLAGTVQRVQKALAADAAGSGPDDGAPLLAALRQLLPGAAQGSAPAAARLRWVRASQGELMHQIAVEDVLFFQADDKYTVVRTAERELLIRSTIAELVQQLEPADFVQAHRGTIVNLRHLAGTRRDEASRLYLRIRGHAQELPVSRAYVHLFKAM
jgi:DNA-binding LytR/AlgR family response regulator